MMTGGFINRIFVTALLGGAIAGLVLAGIQQFTVVPMILEAETYETSTSGNHGQSHNHGTEQDHGGAWTPEDGAERSFYTFVTSMIAGIGFALLLAACFALQETVVDWRRGILWGLGGFATFNLAPAIGLPPELPGAAAADLESRQLWWVLTAVLTAGGLLMLVFVSGAVRWFGVALIAFPHLLGAPQPDSSAGGLASAELETSFIYVSLISGAIFWVVLGAVTAHLYRRFSVLAAAPQP